MLTPIQLIVEGDTQILEATIRKMNRPATQVVLDRSKLTAGILGISWKILEQDDGCIVQVIYAGSASKTFSMLGDIVGQRQLSEVKYSGKFESPAEKYTKDASKSRLLSGAMFLSGIVVTIGAFVLRRHSRKRRNVPYEVGDIVFRGSRFVWIMISVGISYIVFGCFLYYQSHLPGPPFGF